MEIHGSLSDLFSDDLLDVRHARSTVQGIRHLWHFEQSALLQHLVPVGFSTDGVALVPNLDRLSVLLDGSSHSIVSIVSETAGRGEQQNRSMNRVSTFGYRALISIASFVCSICT
jgi:hypothetical protein